MPLRFLVPRLKTVQNAYIYNTIPVIPSSKALLRNYRLCTLQNQNIMKKIILSLSVLALLAACNNASENKTASTGDTAGMAMSSGPTDTVQARKDLEKILDEMHDMFTKKDVGYIDKYMAKDGIFFGTDPGEVWNFDELRKYTAEQFKDTTIKSWEFNTVKRVIRVNGPSANMVEQFYLPGLSKKLMWRTVAHAHYENGRWLMDMLTYNAIPKNDDLRKIEQAL